MENDLYVTQSRQSMSPIRFSLVCFGLLITMFCFEFASQDAAIPIVLKVMTGHCSGVTEKINPDIHLILN